MPTNERLSRVNVRQDTDSDTLTNTVPDTDNVDLTPKHKINTPILEETESTLGADDVVRSQRGRKGCVSYFFSIDWLTELPFVYSSLPSSGAMFPTFIMGS